MDERLYWLGFSAFPGIGPKRFALLLQQFSTAKTAWEANEKDLEAVIGKQITFKFTTFRKAFDLQKYYHALQQKGIIFLTQNEESYPSLVKQSVNPPFVLYIKGKLPVSQQNSIAIVGTRNITSYGKDITERITYELVNAGYVIVSGLAMGVDEVAHSTTIANNGITIAVLGCGIDCCYPATNQRIYDAIVARGGCIVSEWGLGFPPNKGSFPARNRIIAGLSQAVVVTEGAADSGALYTANDAFTMNRPVFAVPGPITSSVSKGPHALINKGAKLVTSVDDILKELGRKSITRGKSIKGDSENEQKVIDCLENEFLLFDEISKKTNISAAELGMLLTMMEMKKKIKSIAGGKYSLNF